MTTTQKASLLAASALFGLLGAGASNAIQVTINGSGIYDPDIVSVNGENAYSAVVDFNTIVGTGQSALPQTLYGFCVDLSHVIYVGIDSAPGHDVASHGGDAQSGNTLDFQTSTLKYDSSGSFSGASGLTLSSTQVGEIGGLASYGRGLILNADTASPSFDSQKLSDELAGVQDAIWTIEYPSASIIATGAQKTYLDYGLSNASAWALQGPVTTIYATNGATQGFVVGSSNSPSARDGFVGNFNAVPEPISWSLMFLGFGLSGMLVRRRRSLSLVELAAVVK